MAFSEKIFPACHPLILPSQYALYVIYIRAKLGGSLNAKEIACITTIFGVLSCISFIYYDFLK